MSDLDDLMTDDPLDLSKQSLDAIVAYYRKRREGKVEKVAKPVAETVKITLADLGLAKPKAEVKRRF